MNNQNTNKLKTAQFIVQQFKGLKEIPSEDHPEVLTLMKEERPVFNFLLQRAHELNAYGIGNIFSNIFKRVCNLFT